MTPRQFKDDIVPYSRLMWHVAYALLADSEDASDAVQEAMARLWSARNRLAGVDNPRAYCVRTARNIALSMLAGRPPTHDLTDSPDMESASEYDSDRTEMGDAVVIVTRAIDSMPPSQAEVMRLSSFAGLSNSEIADLTGLSPENVRVILSRGCRKLKSMFGKLLER